MVVYYISYGPPPRRSFWRPALLALLILLALSVAAAVAYGIYELASGGGGGSPQADAAGGVPLAEVLPELYQDDTNIIFLVDTSESVALGGHLPAIGQALARVALPYIDGGAGQAPKNIRAALVPFAEDREPLLKLASLEESDVSMGWLIEAGELRISDHPAYIYDAVDAAHAALEEYDDGTVRDNVIVLLTDGSDGGFERVSYPFPVHAESCPPEWKETEKMCVVEESELSQYDLIPLFVNSRVSNLKVYTIGLDPIADRESLELLAVAGGGQYIHCSSGYSCQ